MRSTTRLLSLLLALTVAIAAVACSDDDTTADKGVTTKDGGGDTKVTPTPDQGPAPVMDCTKNTCTDFVMDKIIMPVTSGDAQKYSLVFKGKKYNALGNILALLAAQAPNLGIQESIDGALCAGSTIVLMKVQAKSMTADVAAVAQALVGAEQKCCPTADKDKSAKDYATKCCTEAKSGCFGGTGTHCAATGSPTDMLFKGKIAGGAAKFGPSKMKLKIPLTSAGTLDLTLKYVHIEAKTTANKMTEGVLSGAIPKSDLDKNVIPQVASMLNKTYIDPTTDKSTKDMIKQLFDTDADGKITTQEVKDNALIKTFLAGDVDVDGDGENELSLGIGFTATTAKIADKCGTTPTPDTGTTPADTGTTPADTGTSTPDAGQ